MFNSYQEDHMRYLAALDPDQKCYCGWYSLNDFCSTCRRDHPGKTNADKRAEIATEQQLLHEQGQDGRIDHGG